MTMDIKVLIKEYRHLREELDARRVKYNTFEKQRKLELLEIETLMLKISNETGIDSFKSEDGTAFKTIKTYARLSAGEDAKQARIDYAIKTGDFGLFTSHVNKTHTKELIDDGVNVAEAGIDWVEEYAMNFRKPTK